MEGGVICTDDEELYQILLCIRAHGWTRNLPEENMISGRKSIDPFEESFKFVLPGYNIRPIEMAGALGIEQVKKLPSLIHERQENGQLWQEKMTENPHILIQKEVGSSSWFGFSMVIRPESKLKRPELVKKLIHHGFECRPIVAGNFAKNPVVKRYFDYEIYGSLENANYIDSHGLFIGNQHYSISDAIEFISTLEM
jgi:CDP-6-deoxy-D-xylo-4-hexulose-3-dehydrase